MPDLTDHKDLVGAKLAQGDRQVKVVIESGDRGLDETLQLIILDTADVDAADLRDGEDAITIHNGVVIDIHLPPGAH